MMNVNLLEKLQEEEKLIEANIHSLENQRDALDDNISKLRSKLHAIHTEASDEIFGAKE